MRFHCSFSILAITAASLVADTEVGTFTSGAREEPEISAGWRFQIDSQDIGEHDRWFDAGFDRSGWKEVDVPRAWDVLDRALSNYEGVGWYSVVLDGSWARPGQIQHLKFGRVMYHARVWLNGELLGEHVDGYLPFAFDITDKLKGPANHLVVRVDNRPQIDWLPAAKVIEWVQYGGILQPVRIESHGPVFLSDLNIRAKPAGDGASVACTARLNTREGAIPARLVFKVEISGDAARVVGPMARSAPLVHDGRAARVETAVTLRNATPWSPDTPVLYTLVAKLERDGQEIDRLVSQFGVRTIVARGRQLLLNGRALKIKGVNRYDEYGGFGPNPPQALLEDELRLMKQAGVNLIRSHYPQSPEFLSLCDRSGILFLAELPINWWGVEWFGKDDVVQDEKILDRALPMLETMIRRDRNHPCVIIWSVANESKTESEIGTKVMRTLIRRTRELDPTRLVTFVTAPGSVRDHGAFEEADLVATNMYHGSLIAPLAEHRDQLEARARRPTEAHLRRELSAFPGKPLLITEFGALGLHGLRGDAPATEEFQAEYIRAVWTATSGVEDVTGGVLWSWADYNHRRASTSLGPFGAYGAVTIDRKPKAALKSLAAMYGGSLGN